MNFQEFCNQVAGQPKPADLREGQHWSNQLWRTSPLAYSRIPSELDPFYNDEQLSSFLTYLESNWVTLTTPLNAPTSGK